ncbi:MAG: alanine--tRNA ligase [Verrucomicrobiales bacterium]
MVTFSTIDRRKLAPAERDLVLKSILHAERERQYHLYIACVMPDHVHLLFEPQIKDNADEGNPVFWSLSEILQGIKSTSAHAINKARGRKGPVWEKESLDRMIRSESDLEEKFRYICRNPWDEAVVRDSESYNWLWTFASDEGSGEHTRPRVSQSAPSPIAAVNVESTAGAPSTAREGACAPQNSQSPRHAQIEQEKIDVAFRVIADHIRTLSFAIADGIQPGNTDRNYVLRRILRRAVRYGRTLGFHEPFFYKLVDVLARTMGDVFPEIRLEQKHIEEVLRREEEAFGKTLDKGLAIFESAIHPVETTTTATREPGETAITHSTYLRRNQLAVNEVSASLAFQLYDTYGFPLDLTELMARERGLSVDTPGFEKLMEEQRARARKAQKKQVIELSQIETTAPTRFVGYDMLSTTARVLEVVGVKERTAVVLDRSCAYAEMGGQVGDTGELIHGGQLWRLVNTQKSGNTWLHLIEDTSSADESAPRDAQQSDRNGHAPHPAHGMEVHLTVDANRRQAIERHHTVTHLLHWALHEVVSRDATQKGSYVGPEKLTFDFNSAALTPVQLRDVERLVNERIVENTGVSWTEVPYSEIKSRVDILQFFGDRYGDSVRVVQIGGEAGALNGYSMELCAGTHTRATGQIGLFRIAGEAAIAAGVRRIEAVAGLQACDMMHAEAERLKQLAAKLGAPVPELERKLDALLTQQKELEKILKSARQREASTRARELLAMATNQVIVANLGDVDGDYAMAVAEALKGLFNGIIVLGATGGGNVALIANVPTELQSRIQAGKIIQAIAPMVGGKGGGKPDFARGGGREPGKLEEALAEARRLCGLGS